MVINYSGRAPPPPSPSKKGRGKEEGPDTCLSTTVVGPSKKGRGKGGAGIFSH